MRLAQHIVCAAVIGVAGLAASFAVADAQEPGGKVFMPWQKPQSRPAGPPNFKEILPWLIGEDASAKVNAQSEPPDDWDTELSSPKAPVEPVVPEPTAAASRLETGGITANGLVLKTPLAAAKPGKPGAAATSRPIHAAAATAAAPKTEKGVASPGHQPVDPSTAAETSSPLNSGMAEDAVVPPDAAAKQMSPLPPESVPEADTELAQTSDAPVPAAPAMPTAEEAPPIPDPLPEAVVTPVAKPAIAGKTKEADDRSAGTAAAEATGKASVPEKLADGANVAQQYCFNIADAAKDARYAWQKKTLADIEGELNKRIALLDERTAEYQKWLARRDEFIRTAEENVVKIYAGMKADTAATQLALMNEEAAAAVLAKLNTRNASAILNEMDPGKAAKLTMIITGAAKLRKKKEQQKATQDANVPAPGDAQPQAGGRT